MLENFFQRFVFLYPVRKILRERNRGLFSLSEFRVREEEQAQRAAVRTGAGFFCPGFSKAVFTSSRLRTFATACDFSSPIGLKEAR
jgi:hypothetical protein